MSLSLSPCHLGPAPPLWYLIKTWDPVQSAASACLAAFAASTAAQTSGESASSHVPDS